MSPNTSKDGSISCQYLLKTGVVDYDRPDLGLTFLLDGILQIFDVQQVCCFD
jgi:hypothetical protein